MKILPACSMAGTTDGGHPYFVMEFVEGKPIDEYCNEGKLGAAARLIFHISRSIPENIWPRN